MGKPLKRTIVLSHPSSRQARHGTIAGWTSTPTLHSFTPPHPLSAPPQLRPPCSSSALPSPSPGALPPAPLLAALLLPPSSAVSRERSLIVRCPLTTIAGDVNEKATADKEAGHSASSPSVIEGYKKLDRTCQPPAPRHPRYRAATGPPR